MADDFPEIDPDALARAEAALARLSEDYLTWAEADVATLRTVMAEIHAHPADRPDALWRLFRAAHDMKGQAATFGYPLVTEIANRLCRLIEAAPDPGPDAVAAIGRHVDALAGVITRRLDGNGGPEGARLLDALETGG